MADNFSRGQQSGTGSRSASPVSQAITLRQTNSALSINGDRFRVAIPVDPGFPDDCIDVQTTANQIQVKARLETRNDSATNKSVQVREFSTSYAVPRKIDPQSVSKHVENNVMIVEGCMVRES
ncbi:unnamed protein product [Calicophoron daubneyi]|uniref:SHSP domain-containing protein n=1 Tax=Calicophoron daubneyi TaxID=300641 RepID=A0AAV2T6M8_CALDB